MPPILHPPIRLLLLGATGQVGRHLLQFALDDPRVSQVGAVVRGRLKLDHPKLSVYRMLLDSPKLGHCSQPPWNMEHAMSPPPWDALISGLGTTLKQAGSAEAFVKVDHDMVADWSMAARKMGVKVMGQVSSLGADAKSRQLYLRTKGRAEEMLTQRGFDSLVIVRPSLLDTPPRADWRPGERIALALSRVLRPLIPRRYRPVKAEAVARALLEATLAAQPGVRVIESEELA